MQKSTLAFIISGFILVIIAISLDEKGIIPLYVGTVIVFMGYVYRWRKSLHFIILALVCLLGFPVGVLMHNVFYGLEQLYGHFLIFHWIFEFLHIAFFILAIAFSPTGFLIGIIGLVVTLILKYKRRTQGKREL